MIDINTLLLQLPASWQFEYEINNSSFTATQWNSINSGVTANDVSLGSKCFTTI